MKNLTIINTARTARVAIIFCILFEIFLVAMDLLTQKYAGFLPFHSIRDFFNIALEANLPTFFSSMQFIILGLAGLYLSLLVQDRRKVFLCWFTGLFFVYVGIDDATHLHESIGKVFERIYRYGLHDPEHFFWRLIGQYPSYPWHVTIGPFIILAGAGVLAFFFLVIENKRLIIVGFCALFVLAVSQSLDLWDGLIRMPFQRASESDFSGRYIGHFMIVLEEYLEMLAATVLLYVFLAKAAIYAPVVEINTDSS